jgi:site-specific recombinase XerD
LVDGQPLFGAVKDKKNRPRTIPLADMVVPELVEHVRRYGLGRDGLVFTNERGLPIRRSRFADIWASAARPLGIPVGDGYHQLRHYYASLLIAGGAPITVVQAMLGHASVATTQIYAHLFPDANDQARSAIDRVLGARVSRACHAEVGEG